MKSFPEVDTQGLSDEQLIEALRGSSDRGRQADLYTALFRRYYLRVAAWCLKFTGERDSAYDLAQGVFMRAYSHLDSFRGDSKFSTWLYMVSRNHCLATARRWSTEPAEIGELVSQPLVDHGAENAHERIEREEATHLLWQLVDTVLSETEARIVRLHYSHEVPLDVITRLLGLTNQSGAKAYIVSARRKLISATRALQHRPLVGATA